MNKLRGHVVRLVRSILLRPPTAGRRPSSQFFAGKRDPFAFGGGMGIEWWYAEDTRKAVEAVASLIIQSADEFRDCDIDSAARTITDTLQQICVDKRLFDPDAVVFSARESLFECRRPIPIEEFVSGILAAITENLRASLGGRCTVYAVPRLDGASILLEDEGVHAVARSDNAAWQQLESRGYKFDGWRPERPQFANGSPSAFSSLSYRYVLVAESQGTRRGANFSAILKLRKLLAVLCAVISSNKPYGLPVSAADPYQAYIQFPHADCVQSHVNSGECGALLPYYAMDVAVLDDHIATLKQWYAAQRHLSAEGSGRVDKCAHFISRAMNSSDIEAFIGYFVALDALFGQRGSVERSILSGVARLPCPEANKEKAAWLFELRNELVHGGSRYIAEWPKYQRYYRHFDTRPEHDVRQLAMSALVAAPSLLKN